MTKFHKNENFRRINVKINRLFEKIYSKISTKFESNWCSLYWVIAKTKIDNLPIHTFSADDFFFSVNHIYIQKKVEIWQLIFDPDSRLYSIKDWESKIKHITIAMKNFTWFGGALFVHTEKNNSTVTKRTFIGLKIGIKKIASKIPKYYLIKLWQCINWQILKVK